jgi:hypothetical protein
MITFTIEIEEDETTDKLSQDELDHILNLMEDIAQKRNLEVWDTNWEKDDF